MTVPVPFQNGKLTPAFINVTQLIRWTKPGRLALKLAGYRAQLEGPAKRYEEQLDALIDELVVFETVEGKKQRRTRMDPTGRFGMWDFGENEAEFKRREKELREGVTEISVSSLLTAEDIEKMERDRVKDGDNQQGADLSFLFPLIEPSVLQGNL